MSAKYLDEIPDYSILLPGGRVGVLLIHGLGGTPVELRFVAQNLARAGYTVLCCQLAGHGGTPENCGAPPGASGMRASRPRMIA